MKKVLVLSLVLVMALASSAFAAVNFGGKFTATVENDSFTDGDFKINTGIEINIDAKASDEGGWSFEAKSNLSATKFELGAYKLELNDDYFDLYFWGNDKKLEDKQTTLGLLKAGELADKDEDRARLVVDAVEPVTLTVDFEPGTGVYVFADATISGVDAGLAYLRNGGLAAGDEGDNTIGIWGKGSVDMFTIQGDVAATLGEELALGYGAKVTAKPVDELEVYAQYIGTQEGFVGDKKANIGDVEVGATYTESDYRVKTTLTYDVKADADPVAVSAEAQYRFSETVAYGDLFKSDKYYNNDAPAVGVSTKFAKGAIEHVTLDVASPVVEDMIWARAYGKYMPNDGANDFEAGAYARIKATDKLTIDPAAVYKTNGSVIDLSSTASYLIGSSDTALKLTVQKVMTEDGFTNDKGELVAKELVKAAVEVKF